MTKQSDIRICDIRLQTETFDYRTPIKFGGRVVNNVVLARVEIDVEARDGRSATGFGAMPIGNVWAWPSNTLGADQTEEAMLAYIRLAVEDARQLSTIGHPLELSHDFSNSIESLSQRAVESCSILDAMPTLAALVAGSPIDAALHDAYGRLHQANSYQLLGADYLNRDLAHYLDDNFAGEYLDQYVLKTPKPAMPLYHLVGALDPVQPLELKNAIGDGLPETLGDWIIADGLTHLKIKLNGDNLEWDVHRVCDVEQVACEAQQKRGQTIWHYSLDFNEKCPDEDYVLAFLTELQTRSPDAISRVQYIEQPTHRDLSREPRITMHRVAQIKPVVIDESLIDYESLQAARELGYSGVALKACKGHSEALLMGAAAQKFNLFLCVQDLTCIGYSFLHSASLAARIPTIAAIEGNGRQYCPAGNAAWVEHFPGMFRITDGTVKTKELDQQGLGFDSFDARITTQ